MGKRPLLWQNGFRNVFVVLAKDVVVVVFCIGLFPSGALVLGNIDTAIGVFPIEVGQNEVAVLGNVESIGGRQLVYLFPRNFLSGNVGAEHEAHKQHRTFDKFGVEVFSHSVLCF